MSLAPAASPRPWAERAVAAFARWPLAARVAVPVAGVVLTACLAASAVDARMPADAPAPTPTTVVSSGATSGPMATAVAHP